MNTISVSQFEQNPGLLQCSPGLVVLVKWLGQEAVHDANLAALFDETAQPPVRHYKNEYFGGLLGVADTIPENELSARGLSRSVSVPQPTGAAFNGDLSQLLVATGNKLVGYDTETLDQTSETTHDWFARLHTVEVDPRTGEILTVSSAYDTIYGLRPDGSIAWEFDFWNEGHGTNRLGQSFRREKNDSVSEGVVVNPPVEQLLQDAYPAPKQFSLTDPAAYNHRGLPTKLTPHLINSVSRDGKRLLATSFHGGQSLVVEDGRVRVVGDGLRYPHGFVADGVTDAYRVTDTGHERVLFMDENFAPTMEINFADLPGRKPALTNARWLQNVTHMGGGSYCGVLQPHSSLVFFNPAQKTFHMLPFDRDWGVQEVLPYPGRTEKS